MFADPFSIKLNATITPSAGTDKSLVKINQDGYGSEYLLQEATRELRMKIRHSKESVKAGGRAVDRHNVEITEYVYPVAPATVGTTRQIYAVMRNHPDDDKAAAVDLMQTLAAMLVETNLVKLVGWES